MTDWYTFTLQQWSNFTLQLTLRDLTDSLRNRVLAQYLSRRFPFERSLRREDDESTIGEEILSDFDGFWQKLETRLLMVPGKELLSLLNKQLQAKYQVSVSHALLVDCFRVDEIPQEMTNLIADIDEFRISVIDKKNARNASSTTA